MKYLILIFFSINGFAQVLFEGVVKSANTKESLAGAAIYIPNSTYGTYSDENGKFSIQLPLSTKEIVISFIGYHPINAQLNISDGKNINKTIYLRENNSQLNEVVVIKQKQDKEWYKKYEIFKSHFIGDSEIAKNAEILNPEDLILIEEKDSIRYKLTANAYKPLLIKNKTTGYIITYELIQFNYINYGHSQLYTFYLGYAFFKDITSEEKLNSEKVAKKRLEAYSGSSMHFIRALYQNKLFDEGFSVRELTRKKNPEFPDEKTIKNIYRLAKETNDYSEVRKIPKYETIKLSETIIPSSKFMINESNKKILKFENYLNVTYTKSKPDKKYLLYRNNSETEFQISQLKIENEPVEIFADGNYYSPNNLFFYGYMGWKKVGDMLPFDYQP